MYKRIEHGAKWPNATRVARAVALAKTEPPPTTYIYQYRLLLMLSAAYRLWAQARLSAVKPWITGWDMDEVLGFASPGHDSMSATF